MKKDVLNIQAIINFPVPHNRKTVKRLAEHFFWPKMKEDMKRYVNSCMACQMVIKPNQKMLKAPLVPIPSVGEPFQEVVMDIVGPLPRTRGGNEYLLTLMDRMSKYPGLFLLGVLEVQK